MANTYYTLQSGLMFHLFEGSTYNKPNTLAIGLCGPVPNNRSVVELLNQSGYSRVTVSTGGSNWSYQLDGKIYNNNVINFNPCSGYVGWTSGLFISDSGVYGAGNILFFSQHSVAKELNTNDQISIPVSGLNITLT